MNILFVSANTETAFMVPLPLGLNLLAVAARNAGHGVELLDLMGSDDWRPLIGGVIGRFRPELICVSVRNIDNQSMGSPRFLLEPVRDVVAFCRRQGVGPVVVGGAGFSIFPRQALDYLEADMGICGEGETALLRLVETLRRKGDPSPLAGLCMPGSRQAICPAERSPLATLPLPDPALWTVPAGPDGEPWVPFQTRRGCPLGCSYCSTATLEGRIIRKHPLGEVLECIGRHVACGYRRFYFVDNVFNLPGDYARQLCGELARAGLGISWRCILYPGFIDEELVRSMAEAGCVEVSLGFESGNDSVLAAMNKRFDARQVRSASRLLASHGIRRNGFLLLGGPGETRESVVESLAFADSLALDTLKLTVGIRIYPGTTVERIALEEGVITPRDNLLFPRFYLARGLEEWLFPTVREWLAGRPNCLE